ncbi:MAG: conjugal transfer protein TraC [Candidatus Spechtbacteria bacterium RIFCSPLOWO2_12_FULL_38_22]|uniref:Conjugal transfer protein TraC n=1 Tax=Candidatus Spechtbacteria bacterium RIFCSPLOWO2_12_FULL_38_22 TaxID=1802165 RepID=A0A1G2HIB3_9BACT|nr:MAG: conjugal transfer protein TraC [Candidatus Spechtbacteria bacterium RIFCSPHIGHO2_12_FULL_38_30]OGZ60933.1 MAG: conjugal transfer protein TraC [Candidatus Spechtbacteria bacterium RIFCSPLOWO2_01_FULL_38_20]OGZ62242.1 MAG: conjugal transfer protein TraC [Candidatus Spechtbacteria bacterium RIFCSPLOWO2_12_FULL_38_22]
MKQLDAQQINQKELEQEKKRRLINVLAPPVVEIEADFIKLGGVFVRTLFISSYPRFLSQNWISPIINLDETVDVSIFIQPIPTESVLKKLESQLTGVEADMMEREKKGLIRDPLLEAAYTNIEDLRDKMQTSEERVFKFGLYLMLYGKTKEALEDVENKIKSLLESRLIYAKPVVYKQEQGIVGGLPLGIDNLKLNTSLNTSSLSASFPFVSFDLSDNKGILYGINRHNSSLILFDRFSLENANTVVLGKSGGGKSYAVKLEILRSLMLGIDNIVIDPENEYKYLAEATGGSFFHISLTSGDHINPFDIPQPQPDDKPQEVYRANVITLMGLLKLMLGSMTPEEESVLNEAIDQTYASYDITADTESFWKKSPPLMRDLQAVLESMQGGEALGQRLEKYTKGIYSGFLNERTNVELNDQLVVLSIRDMEEELRPIAMYIIIDYIWGAIRRELKKRILTIDEAWWMLQQKESASFLFGIAKRARKYFLGLTTISQDIADFLSSDYGRAIIANSSLQILMKQSPTTIDQVQEVFNLTDEEKLLLLEDNVGEGLFFAGTKHVAIKIMSSYIEDQIITSDPEQLLEIKRMKEN